MTKSKSCCFVKVPLFSALPEWGFIAHQDFALTLTALADLSHCQLYMSVLLQDQFHCGLCGPVYIQTHTPSAHSSLALSLSHSSAWQM